jgi:toxin YoeB
MYKLFYTKEAQKDAKKIASSELKHKIQDLLKLLEQDLFISPPPFKKLKGQFEGCFSRRINLKHRLFYQVDEEQLRVKILRMWTHYGDN